MNVLNEYCSEYWENLSSPHQPEDLVVPEMAICWILNWMLMVGFSSGLEAPACRHMVPFRLGSFWGLIFPTSHDRSCTNTWHDTHSQRTWGVIIIHVYTLYIHFTGINVKRLANRFSGDWFQDASCDVITPRTWNLSSIRVWTRVQLSQIVNSDVSHWEKIKRRIPGLWFHQWEKISALK